VQFDTATCSYTAPGVPALNNQQDIAVCLADSQYSITAMSLTGSNTITFDHRGLIQSPSDVTLQSGSRTTTIEVSNSQATHEHL